VLTRDNKNLAIADRSRVSCAHNTSRAFTGLIAYSRLRVTVNGTIRVAELFDVEYYRDLKMWVRGHSIFLKIVSFESLGTVSYSPSIVTMVVSLAISEIFSVKE